MTVFNKEFYYIGSIHNMATASSIILLQVLSISCLCSTRDVYIQPSEDEHCPGTPCYNITTFGKMTDSFSNSSGLVVQFLEGTHLLNLQELMVFTNLTNAVFEGDGRMEQGFHETVWQSTVVIKCTQHSSTGIAFVNSSNITFRYITITNCGADMTPFHQTRLFCTSSLGYFKTGKSTSIAINHVSIQNGTGSGLLIETDGVDLVITDSSFAQNGISGGHMHTCNIAILYIDPSNCDHHHSKYKMLITNTNTSFGGKKGILVHLLQRSYSIDIVLFSVTAYGNRGSNIVIRTSEHDVPNYNLTITNLLSTAAHGHGLMIDSSQVRYIQCSTPQNTFFTSTIAIVNSTFTYNNNNDSNGVVSINLVGVKFITNVTIWSTEICHNIGFGLKINLFSYQYSSNFFVTLENFAVTNNSWPYDIGDIQPTVYAVFIAIFELRNVSITNNFNMTGLAAYHSTIVVNGTVVFHNNTGIIDGGGLALYANSYLVLHEHAVINFTYNSARLRGGAIFVEKQLDNAPCFFQYSDNTLPRSVKVTMIGNKADIAGTALFGGEIGKCLLFRSNQTYGSEYFNETFDYSAQTGSSVISSEPTDVCFCDDNNTINCSQTQLTVTAYPGEEINISVVTVGQLNGVAPAILQIHNTFTHLGLRNTSAVSCKAISLKSIYETYILNVLNSGSIKKLKIVFRNCPLGFKTSSKTKSCDCEKLKHKSSTITCDAATKMMARHGDIWIGNINGCVIMQTPCPFDYCNTAQVSFSPTDPDPQCALNRTGILCGRCQDGLSLALGSNNCIHCPRFSYLALIIPFAAAGFGLVALLMVLNLTVSIGTINGLIFYANIVKISESSGIFFPNGTIPVLSQFIAWLNLDLGIETCFYQGMTAYHKVWLQFVFPLYIWFIIATIIVLCRYSTWLSNKIGGNVVQVLATLILLSFTKIFRTIVLAMKYSTLSSFSCVNSGIVISKLWSVDANVAYFSPRHFLLMAAAVLFLLLAVSYTLALLFDVVIEKYLTRIRSFRRQWIKFKPFVDAYHGPYKDNCRFWTGLLLLVRMSFTLISFHLIAYYGLIFITASSSLLLSLMVVLGGVYQKNYLNILEWSSLINLTLLSAIYSGSYERLNAQNELSVISVSSAFSVFLGVISFHVILYSKNLVLKLTRYCNNHSREAGSLLHDDEEGHTCQQLVQPTTSEVCLRRESLIY